MRIKTKRRIMNIIAMSTILMTIIIMSITVITITVTSTILMTITAMSILLMSKKALVRSLARNAITTETRRPYLNHMPCALKNAGECLVLSFSSQGVYWR
ncbi:MAG: hypothetical protein IKX36_09470 [Prevotella sp.]|nr:hypothetical protein [Prevotella sp.]